MSPEPIASLPVGPSAPRRAAPSSVKRRTPDPALAVWLRPPRGVSRFDATRGAWITVCYAVSPRGAQTTRRRIAGGYIQNRRE
jgi:hypothetical protein